MGRKRMNLSDTIRGELLTLLREYATSNACIPNMHSFYVNVVKKSGYDISLSTFRWHWDQLHKDGYLRTDQVTGALIVIQLSVVEKDD